jgi:hypothetical protein
MCSHDRAGSSRQYLPAAYETSDVSLGPRSVSTKAEVKVRALAKSRALESFVKGSSPLKTNSERAVVRRSTVDLMIAGLTNQSSKRPLGWPIAR